MTFEERLAALGVDLSDLPTDYTSGESWAKAFDAAYKWSDENGRKQILEPVQYILHLTDIIDRMETRIVNLTGERDYLIKEYGYGCQECARYYKCHKECGDSYECYLVENWDGMPEYWEVDDETD